MPTPMFSVLQFPYAEAIIRESLRLYPPATLVNREVKEGGFDLMGKVGLCVHAGFLHPDGHGLSAFTSGQLQLVTCYPPDCQVAVYSQQLSRVSRCTYLRVAV